MPQKIRVVRKRLRRTQYIAISLYVMFVLLSLFVMSSYTWFSLSRTPRVTNMNVYITSAAGLELSADKNNWELQLNVWDTELVPVDLRPATWSEDTNQFWAAAYGTDGRQLAISQWHPLTDDRHANKMAIQNGYYMKATYYARSGMVTDVELAPALLVNEEGTQGAGTYVLGVPGWDLESLLHVNSGKGAESCLRVGFLCTPGILTDADGNGEFDTFTPNADRGAMYIYEPNMDRHQSGTGDYIPTPSIDGGPTLVPEDRMILQKASGWADMETPEISNIQLSLGEFVTNQPLFRVIPGEVVQIEMYIWLEGQDIDCANPMNGAQLMANIQFRGTTEAHTGMVPIE